MQLIITGRPISKKNSKRIIGGRSPRLMSSDAYIRFEENALSQIESKRCLKGKLDISYVFYMKGKLDSDLDNMIAGINDILEKAEVIENDKNIVSMSAIKMHGANDWKTEIEITKI